MFFFIVTCGRILPLVVAARLVSLVSGDGHATLCCADGGGERKQSVTVTEREVPENHFRDSREFIFEISGK